MFNRQAHLDPIGLIGCDDPPDTVEVIYDV